MLLLADLDQLFRNSRSSCERVHKLPEKYGYEHGYEHNNQHPNVVVTAEVHHPAIIRDGSKERVASGLAVISVRLTKDPPSETWKLARGPKTTERVRPFHAPDSQVIQSQS
jgi:hypothetical protein